MVGRRKMEKYKVFLSNLIFKVLRYLIVSLILSKFFFLPLAKGLAYIFFLTTLKKLYLGNGTKNKKFFFLL